MMINARQLTAARALLGLTQEQLAQASGTSPGTINKFEKGDSISFDKLQNIRTVLERKGIEFIGGEGVIRRSTSVRTYTGPASAELFYEDLLSTIKTRRGLIAATFDTQASLALALGVTSQAQTRRLEKLSKYAEVNCLLFNANDVSDFSPTFKFRAIAKSAHQPFFQIIYGNKFAIIVTDGKDITYVVIESSAKAHFNMEMFEAEWLGAFPVSLIPRSQPELVV